MSGPRKGAGRAVAMLIVTATVLGMLLALRPDRWLAGGGASQPPASSPSTGPGTGAPPGAGAAWRSLQVSALVGGPAGARSLVAWSGGYLALGLAPGSAAAAGASGTGGPPAGASAAGSSLVGWTSPDGQAWAPLPTGLLGGADAAQGAADPGGILLARRVGGVVDALRSTDGRAWAPVLTPPLVLDAADRLAGAPGGFLGVVGGDPTQVAFSSDGLTWQTAMPPGLLRSSIEVVAVFHGRLVALGSQVVPVVPDASGSVPGSTSREITAGWWSSDGLTWQAASLGQLLLGQFVEVDVGAGGLIAISEAPGSPGRRTLWQSSDGVTWSPSDADPLGVVTTGALAGSIVGRFSGDGVRLLAYGIPSTGGPVEWWTSSDGSTWSQLTLGGDAPVATGDGGTAFVMRDGVLLATAAGSWLGLAGS